MLRFEPSFVGLVATGLVVVSHEEYEYPPVRSFATHKDITGFSSKGKLLSLDTGRQVSSIGGLKLTLSFCLVQPHDPILSLSLIFSPVIALNFSHEKLG